MRIFGCIGLVAAAACIIAIFVFLFGRPFFYFSEKFSQPQNGEFFKSLKMSYFHYLEKFSGRNWNFILPQKRV